MSSSSKCGQGCEANNEKAVEGGGALGGRNDGKAEAAAPFPERAASRSKSLSS